MSQRNSLISIIRDALKMSVYFGGGYFIGRLIRAAITAYEQ